MRATAVPAVGALAHPRDAWLLAAGAVHVAAIVLVPSPVVVGVLFWWTANTVAHNFIHNPFFRDRRANAAFTVVLTLVLGVPQAWWRARHLAHHAGVPVRLVRAPGLRRDSLAAALWWAALLVLAPGLVATVFVPGLLLGLGLSWLQGHYEHARGVTNHEGALYNALFFNDGHHAEHHARPGLHWAELPHAPRAGGRQSALPAVLRAFETHPLDALERIALRSAFVRARLLDVHERAFRSLLPALPTVSRVVIVGGGLFPRTAIVLRRLLPDAQLVIVDAEQESLDAAGPHLPPEVVAVCDSFDPAKCTADLVVLPLALVGDREALCAAPPAPALVVHDWLHVRRSHSVVIAWWLAKRLSLVLREDAS